METKRCSLCEKELPLDNFYVKKERNQLYARCKKCHNKRVAETIDPAKRLAYSKKYYKENKERINKYGKEYYRKNTEKCKAVKYAWRIKNADRVKDKRKEVYAKLRQKLLDMYGRECACCGESIEEFLTLEHKKDKKKKEYGKTAYLIATKTYRPDLYEILCWNCNCSKGHYGYCPHEKY